MQISEPTHWRIRLPHLYPVSILQLGHIYISISADPSTVPSMEAPRLRIHPLRRRRRLHRWKHPPSSPIKHPAVMSYLARLQLLAQDPPPNKFRFTRRYCGSNYLVFDPTPCFIRRSRKFTRNNRPRFRMDINCCSRRPNNSRRPSHSSLESAATPAAARATSVSGRSALAFPTTLLSSTSTEAAIPQHHDADDEVDAAAYAQHAR